MMTGSNTIHFIPPLEKAADHKVAELGIVASFRPQKDDPYWVRSTVGGNTIGCPGLLTTSTAEIQTIKLYLNSVISDVNVSYLTLDIKVFYLNTPMNRK